MNPYNELLNSDEWKKSRGQYEESMEIYNKVRSSAVSGENIEDLIDEIIGNAAGNAGSKASGASQTKYDPLILDLGGDGFNIETKELGANFDLDKNGFAEKINWTSKDGFLCLDLNGNGTIDDGGELFGDQTLLADGTAAKNGFEALAQYSFVLKAVNQTVAK